jgi:hypothetical protein
VPCLWYLIDLASLQDFVPIVLGNWYQRLNERLAEIGLPPGTVQTMFEFIDLDEGRLKLHQ